MNSANRKNVCYALSPKVYAKFSKIAHRYGISVSGLTRILVDDALNMDSGMGTHRPHVMRRKPTKATVTIKIKRGVRVKIV